jgi:hypothetical protein
MPGGVLMVTLVVTRTLAAGKFITIFVVKDAPLSGVATIVRWVGRQIEDGDRRGGAVDVVADLQNIQHAVGAGQRHVASKIIGLGAGRDAHIKRSEDAGAE